jgi:protein-S-isoprenylcysteine O-methyltransferase Ste14
MLLLRGVLFTLFVPVVIGVLAPAAIDTRAAWPGGAWALGWVPVAAGALIYGACLARFLGAGGTPAIFFTRPLRAVLGEEPGAVVTRGLYRHSRNPMYAGVLLVIAGQAIVRASMPVAWYGVAVFVAFHLVVVFGEEPHLRRTRGAAYEAYCRRVPRWLGRGHVLR